MATTLFQTQATTSSARADLKEDQNYPWIERENEDMDERQD